MSPATVRERSDRLGRLGRRGWRASGTGVLFMGLLLACRKGSATPDSTEAGARASPLFLADEASAGQANPGLAARCRPTERGMRLDLLPEGEGPPEVEIGDGVAYGDRRAVGFLHPTDAGRSAAVALFGADAAQDRIVDLRAALGDAPPPRLAVCRKALVAATLGVARGALDKALLVVSVIDPPSVEPSALKILQHRDDSLDFDFACTDVGAGVAVWDETAAGPRVGEPARGVVRAAGFQVGRPDIRLWDMSPPDSDVEAPRVVAQGAGFFVLWIARRPETPSGDDASAGRIAANQSASEAVGEARTHGWLEMVPVDADGKALGPLRRLTPTSGHVSAFDAQAVEGALLVVARDDGESVDGAGGTLLRMRVRLDGSDTPQVLSTDGLGRGPPAFVHGPGPWLTWVGPREQVRLLPVGGGGELDAAASPEDSLEEARPLVSLAADGRILVATPRDPKAQLRVFACQR